MIYKPVSEVQNAMNDPLATEATLNFAYMEEWNFSGASAPPKDRLFSGARLRLRGVGELLEDGRHEGVV